MGKWRSIQTHALCMLLFLTLPCLSSPKLASSARVPTPARISPIDTANIICQGGSSLMFSVTESIMMANRKGWKRILGGGQLPLQRALDLVPTAHLTTVSHWWCMPFTSLIHLLWHSLVSHAPIQLILPSGLCRLLFPDQWTHSVILIVLLCVFLAAVSVHK